MAMASECTSPSPSDGVTEEKEGVGLFSKIVNCVVELCYEPAKESAASYSPLVITHINSECQSKRATVWCSCLYLSLVLLT